MPNLERHPALRPFSREHVVGLFHAHQLMWLENGRARFDLPTTVENFRSAWHHEIDRHFICEEAILTSLPVAADSLNKLLADHNEIRNHCSQLFANPKDATTIFSARVGRLLEVHIRWEEHHFFPEIENALNAEQLATLAIATTQMEVEHKGTCSI